MKSSIYCCYTPIEPYQCPHHPLIFYFIFKLLFSPFFNIYIKKKKNLFFCLLVHIYYYTSFNLYPPSYLFVSPLLSILYLCLPTSVTYCYTFFIIFSFLYFDYSSSYYILYKFNIISPIQFIFSPQKILSSLSLSLSLSLLSCRFFFSYNSI